MTNLYAAAGEDTPFDCTMLAYTHTYFYVQLYRDKKQMKIAERYRRRKCQKKRLLKDYLFVLFDYLHPSQQSFS